MNKFLITVSLLAMGITGATAALAATDAPMDKAAKHGARHERMFERWDTDGNGTITKAESMAKAEAKFNEMDLNKDGGITKDEAKSAHEAMKAKWAAKKAAAAPAN